METYHAVTTATCELYRASPLFFVALVDTDGPRLPRVALLVSSARSTSRSRLPRAAWLGPLQGQGGGALFDATSEARWHCHTRARDDDTASVGGPPPQCQGGAGLIAARTALPRPQDRALLLKVKKELTPAPTMAAEETEYHRQLAIAK